MQSTCRCPGTCLRNPPWHALDAQKPSKAAIRTMRHSYNLPNGGVSRDLEQLPYCQHYYRCVHGDTDSSFIDLRGAAVPSRTPVQSTDMHIRLLLYVLTLALSGESASTPGPEYCSPVEEGYGRCDTQNQILEKCKQVGSLFQPEYEWTPIVNCYADKGHHCRCVPYIKHSMILYGCFKKGNPYNGDPCGKGISH
ncbi:hypothetical protein EJ03DRAFT_79617 [Teratosphaeria nubilosa]|uniref:Uncharacterized protein n=1 Tax=Teratosphaeria nubilosa TaxID=161662 RepID=A0A6G1LBT0_9PEZI|nr:hypothetical protein EJ03DRAFT_79617 [Teratosphaeria nubilosa]